ncbi:glycerol-3-phosphate acyltransferase [Chloroflexota bacterium]
MIINPVITGLITIFVGYILGSTPSAYIATKLATGKDIRQIGGGNVGGLNTFREVGAVSAIAVLIFDLGKGAAAVAVAYWALELTDLTQPWVLAAGLAAIVGHNWMFWLKFSGGKGMAATIGALVVLMLLYQYSLGLLIFLGVIVVPIIITRNVTLSSAIGLLSLPFIAWFGMQSELFTIWSIASGLLIGLRFLPTAKAAWAKSNGVKDFVFDRWQRQKKL